MYLKALDQWSRPSSESLERVKEFLDQAVALDPEFAAAHCTLGLYYSMLAGLGIKSTHEVIPLARAAVHEALRIEPSMAEAHALLGVWVGGYDNYDWREAERHWRVAMSGELVSCHVHFWYGNHYLMPLGRFHEALAEMKRGSRGIRSTSCTATILLLVSETPAGSTTRKPSCAGCWSSTRTSRWPSAHLAPSALSKVGSKKPSR